MYLISGRAAAQIPLPGVARASSPQASLRPLRIGYLSGEGDERDAAVARLAESLRADEALMETLAAAGFGQPVPAPAASLNDLMENMRIGRYSIVFAPLTALRSWERAEMHVALQHRRSGDVWDSRGQGTRQPCVIIRRAETDTPLGEATWAFVGGESSTGNIYPRLYLATQHGQPEPRDPLIRPSAAEVYYAVMNGIREYGAMDAASFEAIEKTHAARASRDPLPQGYRTARLAATPIDSAPADPVLFARDLSIANGGAGVTLREALRAFAERDAHSWPYHLVPAGEDQYLTAQEDIAYFYSLLEADLAGGAAAQASESAPPRRPAPLPVPRGRGEGGDSAASSR